MFIQTRYLTLNIYRRRNLTLNIYTDKVPNTKRLYRRDTTINIYTNKIPNTKCQTTCCRSSFNLAWHHTSYHSDGRHMNYTISTCRVDDKNQGARLHAINGGTDSFVKVLTGWAPTSNRVGLLEIIILYQFTINCY